MVQGLFMEALMDFSVAIKLEKERLRESQKEPAMIGDRRKND